MSRCFISTNPRESRAFRAAYAVLFALVVVAASLVTCRVMTRHARYVGPLASEIDQLRADMEAYHR